MRQPAGPPGAAANPRRNTVKLADLAGPTVESHPWGKMLAAQTLGGKKPEVSPLSLCVPEDQYFVEFRSLGKLLEASEAGRPVGRSPFHPGGQVGPVATRGRAA